MSANQLYRMSGLSLLSGGIAAAVAHLLRPMEPADPALLSRYASVSQPAHLLLFGGTVLVLLGLPGLSLWQGRVGTLTGSVGALFLYFGILFADTLHCILEFSIFPVLMRAVPYATISIVETTYRSTPLAILQAFGECLVMAGTPLLAIAATRARMLGGWVGVFFFFSSVLMVASLFPLTSRFIGPHYVAALYLSLCALGIAVLLKAPAPGANGALN